MGVTMAVIGAGYWGPNLVRNIAFDPSAELRWVCDLDAARAHKLASTFSGAQATAQIDQVLSDPLVDAVAIATPASTHAELAIRALRSGKHVLIEKPLASSAADAERMIAVAEEEGRVLMCDHTYCYTPAVRCIRQLIDAGELGDVLFVDSVRINLGLVQPDVNVIWDLAPHDLSILDFILPAGQRVLTVAAQEADPIHAGQACVGYLTLELSGGAIAHIHVNWLSPTKVRTLMVGGSRRMVVWDDMNAAQRVAVYDRGVDLRPAGPDEMRRRNLSYRLGDMVAPALPTGEALSQVIAEFAAAVRGESRPVTDGRAGLRILRILEAAGRSKTSGGTAVAIDHLSPAVAA
ncbi:MAG: Gfo/Idh/MocA family protein [Acidimicrobiales bacterium]